VIIAAADAVPSAEQLLARPGFGVEGEIGGRRYRIGNRDYVSELCALGEEQAGRSAATVVWLVDAEGPLASFELADTPRRDARGAIGAIQREGLRTEILSGDARGPVEEVAAAMGIERAQWDLKPDDKLAYVRARQAQGRVVAMVGDGINDAPVLAGADVSIAMGSGAQLAHASADMVMLSEQLSILAAGIRMARRTLVVIRQNLSWALLYNLTAVPLAAAGWVAPWMAAIGMSLSSLVVVFNALRLRSIEPRWGNGDDERG
jgi:Cu2+-exporting ATPase